MEGFGWSYISAIGSITLGWFLNELGQWFRARKEDKKIIKKVLYHLFETHFTFNQLDTSQIIQLITDRLVARIPDEKQKEDFQREFKKFFPIIIGSLIQSDVVDRLKKMEEEYSKSIDSLSTVDPIKAYRLNGKTNILQTFDLLLQKSIKEIVGQFPDEAGHVDVQNQIESTIEILKPKIIGEAIIDLEYEITDLALSINLPTWLKAKKTLSRTKNRLKKEGAKKIDELIDKLLKK